MSFPTRLILASGSPRRRELLSEAGYEFEVRFPSPDAEGPPLTGELPADLVLRLARAKGRDVAAHTTPTDSGKVIVACDTVAVCGGEILGKPADAADARRMLRLLSGRPHEVLSGLCLIRPALNGDPENEIAQLARTTLRMDPLSDAAIDDYIRSDSWEGKAGAFGYQDRLNWIHIVAGSETNVVGLPLELLAEMLAAFGKATP